ncbi:MAG: phytoene/squalene synthase family protein [Halobacteriaceae archaeon]
MPSSEQIAAGKAIHRQTGRTFYYATRLLPERVQEATYVLYGFFRIADEVVDTADPAPPAEQRRRLDEIRAQALGNAEADDPVLAAFNDLREEHGIRDEDVDLFIAAMAQDIETARYETYEALESYMRGSAVSVANMMTAVMDPDDPETALPHAAALGEAFQLTNFLRDVREDIVDRDRIYLPLSTLREHGVTEEQIENLEMSRGFAAAMQSELARTEEKYREGVAGIKYLPRDCQFPVLLAAVLYADHHRLIRKVGYDTLNNEPSLTFPRKAYLVARTYWRWMRSGGDPEAVFHRVSGIAPPGSAHRPGAEPTPR